MLSARDIPAVVTRAFSLREEASHHSPRCLSAGWNSVFNYLLPRLFSYKFIPCRFESIVDGKYCKNNFVVWVGTHNLRRRRTRNYFKGRYCSRRYQWYNYKTNDFKRGPRAVERSTRLKHHEFQVHHHVLTLTGTVIPWSVSEANNFSDWSLIECTSRKRPRRSLPTQDGCRRWNCVTSSNECSSWTTQAMLDGDFSLSEHSLLRIIWPLSVGPGKRAISYVCVLLQYYLRQKINPVYYSINGEFYNLVLLAKLKVMTNCKKYKMNIQRFWIFGSDFNNIKTVSLFFWITNIPKQDSNK